MEWSEGESQTGRYDVYYSDDGLKYIVLKGLDIDQPVTMSPLQEALVPHVTTIMTLYWVLLIVVTVYLVGNYIVSPLWRLYVTTH